LNPPINFFSKDSSFDLKEKKRHLIWLKGIIENNNKKLIALNYIFCSDDYLLELNEKYLEHNYYTDVLTFDNSSSSHEIEGDIFISIDRIKENAKTFDVHLSDELRRIMAHGLLHLLGHRDKTDQEKELMTDKENECLTSFANVPRGTL